MADTAMSQFSFAVPEAESDLLIEFADGLRQVPAHLVSFAGGKQAMESHAETWKKTPYSVFERAAEAAITKASLHEFSKEAMLGVNRQMEGR